MEFFENLHLLEVVVVVVSHWVINIKTKIMEIAKLVCVHLIVNYILTTLIGLIAPIVVGLGAEGGLAADHQLM